ncbi:MAG: sodium:solute symporter, partial [Rhodocyclaceae bacterium]|nr:sodium:solute symporter [Rhodocyclaceae bacterium]
LAYSATLLEPQLVADLIETDPQKILPNLILQKAPLFAQIMFFGALLSAIKSCASATLLAPSVTFTENILRPLIPDLTDRKLLNAMRGVTLVFTVLVTLYAMHSKASIFEMVENAYQVTLVGAFIPLTAGLFWKRATNQGAIYSMFFGISVWLLLLGFGPEDPFLPAQFAGLLASLFGMVVGSLIPQFVGSGLPPDAGHEAIHAHHPAGATHHVGTPTHRH